MLLLLHSLVSITLTPNVGVFFQITRCADFYCLLISFVLGLITNLTGYLHPREFPFLGKVTPWTLRGAVLVGIYQSNMNDVSAYFSNYLLCNTCGVC